MKKILCTIFIFLFILWIGTPSADHFIPMFISDRNEYADYVHDIENSLATWAKKELDLKLTGNGGIMHEQIQTFHLYFTAFRRATLEEARAVTLLASDRLYELINNHEKLRPYLEIYPFTFDRIGISTDFIGTLGPDGDGSISHVAHLGSFEGPCVLDYSSYDSFKGGQYTLLEELRDDAVVLNNESPVQNPAVHIAKACEEPMDRFLRLFAAEVKRDFGFSCWSISAVMPDGIEAVNARFSAFHPASQEQARELLVHLVEMLLKKINSSEKIRPYLKEYPFPLERLRVKICFTTTRHASYDEGMTSIELENNEITYFHRVITPSEMEKMYWMKETLLFGKESYQEAFKMVEVPP